MYEPLRIAVSPGIELEARWDLPADPEAAIVFCHPHPQARGTMTVPLMEKVTGALVDHGMAVLRFNFRGVGASTGHWDNGAGEIDDVAAAMETTVARFPMLAHGIAGWSFGAAISLHWQARTGSKLPWVGIAPPVFREGSLRLPRAEDLREAPRTFIVGDRDQFVTVEQIEDYAASVRGEVHLIKGSDHFFFFREERVADVVTEALCESCLNPG